jgi:hypothetical protein
MPVNINTQRDAVEVTWDPTLSSSETVVLRCTSANDISVTGSRPNDGHSPVTYPKGYSGETRIEVLDAEGNVFDTGDIAIEPKPDVYVAVARAAWKVHEAIWFYGENNAFPEGLQGLPELDMILSDALSRIPPLEEEE